MAIIELNCPRKLERLFDQDLVILFKHSTSCGVSKAALSELQTFLVVRPDVPLHLILVRRERALARYVEERTGVTHESPQVILLRQGEVIAAASHRRVSTEFLLSFL